MIEGAACWRSSRHQGSRPVLADVHVCEKHPLGEAPSSEGLESEPCRRLRTSAANGRVAPADWLV